MIVGDAVDRDRWGRMVRDEWVAWAREQPDAKPSWLVPWEDLTEPEREVDRRIGEALYTLGLSEAVNLQMAIRQFNVSFDLEREINRTCNALALEVKSDIADDVAERWRASVASLIQQRDHWRNQAEDAWRVQNDTMNELSELLGDYIIDDDVAVESLVIDAVKRMLADNTALVDGE